MDDQLLPDFLSDAEDIVAALYEDFEMLRERRDEGAARRELVGRIFRQVHTLKGSAATAGLDAVCEIAHALETLLEEARLSGRVALDDNVLDTFIAATDALNLNLSDAARGTQTPAPRALIARLLSCASSLSQLSADAGAASLSSLTIDSQVEIQSLPDDVARALSEGEQQRLGEAMREGARVVVVAADFALTDFDTRLRALQATLAECGEVVSTSPESHASAPERISFRLVCATRETDAELKARLLPFGATILASIVTQKRETDAAARVVDKDEAMGDREAASSDRETTAADDEEIASHDQSVSLESTHAAPAASVSASARQVRVSLDELDELIAATHELFTDIESALARGSGETLNHSGARVELESREPLINERLHALEARLIELRMVTLRQTLERAVRVGQAAARATGREAEFELAGGDVRLDKSLAEALTEPLLHLLRNAVDHGLELPDERRRAGKDARGRIRLEAAGEVNRVVLRVSDDGRGVDPVRVARIAAERGLVARGAQVSQEQALRLIFSPGFSTSAEASNVSGRGVGLDVIERAVEKLGGEMRVSSTVGAGTTFELRLPVALALVSVLIVRSEGNSYCLDAASVAATCDVLRSEVITHADGAQFINWRDNNFPLVSLRALLGQPPADETEVEMMRVVISRDGAGVEVEEKGKTEKFVAVVADETEENREALVRGLGRHAAHWRGISGATELRDGTVALMLDLARLIEAAR